MRGNTDTDYELFEGDSQRSRSTIFRINRKGGNSLGGYSVYIVVK